METPTVYLLVYEHVTCWSKTVLTLIHVYVSLLGRKRRGTRPGKYVLASASVHRHVLQQLEKMKLIEQDDENG